LQGGRVNDAARAGLSLGLARRAEQDVTGALAAIAEAVALDPQDPELALAHAHISQDAWQPAAQLFARARDLIPGNLAVVQAHANALNSEGQGDAAQASLIETLKQNPDWIEGHRALTSIRTTAGDGCMSARSFAHAVAALPQNLPLRMAWFHTLAIARDWDAAREVTADAATVFGNVRAIALAKIFLASESDTASRDPHLFDAVADVRDVGLDLCRVRFWLRNGDPAQAAAIAEHHIGGSAARTFWPYLSLCWRLTGDRRAGWLDGDPHLFVRSFDLDIDTLALAGVLRALHTLSAPYPEQSVRGGTQTGGQLFFNPDVMIQDARAKVAAAVGTYLADLPPYDPHHPLLGVPRDRPLRFQGSWSVSLAAQGYHSCHTHVRGWISSALYVSLPETPGAPPAGWIEFGGSPPELGLSLKPCLRVKPKPARLVLFPSTLWHGTAPFADGERLTIAFDIAAPVATG
jgi:Tfp pilus assembly protein PilF